MTLQVVHLRVNDAATQEPTPVRLRLTDAAGRYCSPLGRLPSAEAILKADSFHGGNVVLDGEAWAYIDGACEILLPAGPIRVQISKGPRHAAIDQALDRQAGKMALRFEMKHVEPNPLKSWSFADFCVRNLSPKAAALMGAAEGLDFVHLVAEHTDAGELRLIDDFSDEAIAAECGGCKVQVGSFNQGGELGSLVLFNTHRMVHPLRLDQPGFEAYTLHDWCHQAHRKKGMAFAPTSELESIEVLPNLLLGEIDGLLNTPGHASSLDAATLPERLRAILPGLLQVGGSGRCGSAQRLSAEHVFEMNAEEPAGDLSLAEALRCKLQAYRKDPSRGSWEAPATAAQAAAAATLAEAELDRREARIPGIPMAEARRAALRHTFAAARAAVRNRAENVART